MTVTSLKDSNEIRIVQAQKGKYAVVLTESTYRRRYPICCNEGVVKFYVRVFAT
jgi:hypothetical protein